MSDIFRPKSDHKIENNRKVYYSSIEDGNVSLEKEISLNDLLSDRYLFTKRVKIISKDGNEMICNVAGKVSDRIITMDGRHLKIDDIERILLQ